ncbi:hypothetical protein CCP3SC1_1950002 [Gammaproteobacteria bacterium]
MVSVVVNLQSFIRNLAFRGYPVVLCALVVATSAGSPIALARPPTPQSSQLQAEATVSVENPYVQQTVVYTVRVVSRTNVLEFSLDPPTAPGAAVELLEEKPRTYARPTANGQLVVNEYRYALTPLVAGRIEIPPTRLSGKAESPQGPARGVPFQIRTQRISLRSRVMPPNAVQPWLPLQALELVSEGEILQARVGEPFTLSLWLRALGTRGQRLPTLADLLQGPNFRVYPEKAVEYWQDAAPEGNAVRGQRHETLTVVPLKAGAIRLPTLHIPWWDTTKDQASSLEWQSSEITVTWGTEDSTSTAPPVGISLWLLALFAAAIFFPLGWWIGRTQSKAEGFTGLTRILNGWQQMGERLRLTMAKLIQQASGLYRSSRAHLNEHRSKHRKEPTPSTFPRPWANQIHQLLVRILPTTFHTRRLLHHIQTAGNASAISEELTIYATTALSLSPHSPLTTVAEAMIKRHPELDGSTLLQLFHQLDADLYGEHNASQGEERLDIARWKQNFRELTRALRHYQHHSKFLNTERLPPLNPGTGESIE